MNKKTINAKVDRVNGSPNPNSYVLKDNEGKEYLVHLGDIKVHENLLYEI